MMTELWYFDNDGEVDEDDNDDDIDDDDDYVYDFDYNYGDNDVMVMIIDDNTTIVNSTDNYGTHHSSIHYASIIL